MKNTDRTTSVNSKERQLPIIEIIVTSAVSFCIMLYVGLSIVEWIRYSSITTNQIASTKYRVATLLTAEPFQSENIIEAKEVSRDIATQMCKQHPFYAWQESIAERVREKVQVCKDARAKMVYISASLTGVYENISFEKAIMSELSELKRVIAIKDNNDGRSIRKEWMKSYDRISHIDVSADLESEKSAVLKKYTDVIAALKAFDEADKSKEPRKFDEAREKLRQSYESCSDIRSLFDKVHRDSIAGVVVDMNT